MTMNDLMEVVVNECYCAPSLFIENVAAEGWTMSRMCEEVSKMKDRAELLLFVNRFI